MGEGCIQDARSREGGGVQESTSLFGNHRKEH